MTMHTKGQENIENEGDFALQLALHGVEGERDTKTLRQCSALRSMEFRHGLVGELSMLTTRIQQRHTRQLQKSIKRRNCANQFPASSVAVVFVCATQVLRNARFPAEHVCVITLLHENIFCIRMFSTGDNNVILLTDNVR